MPTEYHGGLVTDRRELLREVFDETPRMNRSEFLEALKNRGLSRREAVEVLTQVMHEQVEGYGYSRTGRESVYNETRDRPVEERPSLGYDFVKEPARRIRDAMLDLSYLWGRPLQEIKSYYRRVGLENIAHDIEAARQGKEVHEVLDGKRPSISSVAAGCREMRLSLGDYEVGKALEIIEFSKES